MKTVFIFFTFYILFINALSGNIRKNNKNVFFDKISKEFKRERKKLSYIESINKIQNHDNIKTALNIENNSLEENKNYTSQEVIKVEAKKIKYMNYRRNSSKWSTGAIVGLIVGGVALIIAAIVLTVILKYCKKPSSPPVENQTKTVMYLKTDGTINNVNNNPNNKV